MFKHQNAFLGGTSESEVYSACSKFLDWNLFHEQTFWLDANSGEIQLR